MATIASGVQTTASAVNGNFKFTLVRKDNGVGTLTLTNNGVVVFSQQNAGWDDAIPWESGNYCLKLAGTRFGAPKFDMAADPSGTGDTLPFGRQGIQLHLGNQTTGSQAVTGCVGATKINLDAAKNALIAAGAQNSLIPFEVTGDFGYSIKLATSPASVDEGDSAKIVVSIDGTGAANGLSKDLYLRLAVNEDANKKGEASFNSDYIITEDSTGKVVDQKWPATSDVNIGRWSEGYYLRIPKNNTSASFTVKTLKDNSSEGDETAKFSINDYFIYRQNGTSTGYYSDYLTQPGVLLQGSLPTASITIRDPGKLVSEHLSGGIEGVHKSYNVSAGDVISWNFNAYSVPDSLSISDGLTQSGTQGMVSYIHSGTFTAKSNQIDVTVIGSSSGTAWDLDLSATGAAAAPGLAAAATAMKSQALSTSVNSTNGNSATVTSDSLALAAIASPVVGATLIPVGSWTVAVPTNGAAPAVSFLAQANQEYFARIVSQPTTGAAEDLADGFLQVFGSDAPSQTLENHAAGAYGEPALFFTSDAASTVSLIAGSDITGMGGSATVEVYNATDLKYPILDLGSSNALSTVENADIVIPVSRYGDVSQAATYIFKLIPTGTSPLSADDFANKTLSYQVDFAAGERDQTINLEAVDDGVAEGIETGRIELDTTGLPSEFIANIQQLGLPMGRDISVNEFNQIQYSSLPIITSKNATASEADGHLDFQISLSAASSVPVGVAYSMVDGTATANNDYEPKGGTITFNPGETLKTISVNLKADTESESDEQFYIKLLDPTGASLESGSVVLTYTGTITNSSPSSVFAVHNTATGTDSLVPIVSYQGPVSGLVNQYIGGAEGECVAGTATNDFINTVGGDDAVDGGDGNDVIDGGLGSNFLTGGLGNDTFFVDGRSGGTVWSTITDLERGEWATAWGWQEGVSKLTWAEMSGAEGFKGATAHIDLDNNGTIDMSMTFSRMSVGTILTTTGNSDGSSYLAFTLS